MIKKFMFCVLAIVALTAQAQVKPSIGFVNYYSDDPTISCLSTDLDASSKVYATGQILGTTEDIVTQCTDSTGAIIWTDVFDNGALDVPSKIKIDASGNTFITGYSFNSGTLDWVTRAIDGTGSVLWTTFYDHGVSNDDKALDLRIDSNGDVYVTGKCKNGSGFWNAVTIKYDGGTGTQIWKHIYVGTGSDDIGVCLTLANGQSDVIVAGTTNNGSDDDIMFYKINASTGSTGWKDTIVGTNSGNDKVSSIILAGENIVIAGMLDNTTTGNDYVIAKVKATNGLPVWRNSYDFSSLDRATSLARDSTGNLIVTGSVYNAGTSFYEYHTAFFDSTGTNMWVHKKELDCSSLNVDPMVVVDTIAHHIYISGEIERTSRDILVYQLTPGGNLGWQKVFDRPIFNGTDAATNLVVNGIGVVFVSASTSNGGGYDLTTMKIVQTPVYFPPDYGTPDINDPHFVFQENRGQLLRPNRTSVGSDTVVYYNQGTNPSYYFNPSTISHLFYDRDTVPDSLVRVDLKIINANPYAEIFHYEPEDARKNYFITSTQGITDVRSYGRLFVPEVVPNVDQHHYSNTSGLKSYYVFKTGGELTAALQFEVDGADSTKIDAGGNLIAYTPLGNINMGILTAYQATFNILTPTVPVLVPLTANWQSIGTDMYNFSVSGYNPFWPVVVYVSKPDAGGRAAPPIDNLYWCTFIGDQGRDMFMNSAVDAKDNYYTVGWTYAGTFPFNTGVLLTPPTGPGSGGEYGLMSKFDKFGALVFSTFVGGINSPTLPNYTIGHDIAIDSLYQIYIVGRTTSSNMVMQPLSVSPSLYATNTGALDAFFVKLNPSGNILRTSTYFGGTNDDRFTTIKYWNGQIHIGGWSYSSTIPFYSSQANSYSTSTGNGVYLHLDTSGLVKHVTKVQNEVSDLDIDNNGNTYLISPGSSSPAIPLRVPAGSFYTSANAGGIDWVLQRFGQNDSLNWSTYIGGSLEERPWSISIRDSVLAIAGTGASSDFPFYKPNLSDSGEFTPVGTADLLMMKMNLKTGQRLWSAYHASSSPAYVRTIALDRNYNLFVAGNSSGTGSIRPLSVPGYYQQNSDISADGYLLGYTNNNQRRWTTYFGSLSSVGAVNDVDVVLGMSITNSDRLFLCGYTRVKNNSLPLTQWNNSCYFDWLLADTSYDGSDGLIAMFMIENLTLVGLKEQTSNVTKADFILYPNPNSGKFNIKFKNAPNEKLSVSVINVMGQIVYTANNLKPEANELGIDVGNLSKGIYMLTVKEGESSVGVKIVIE